jgi:formylglycine-generating enzyme required for sulfatase activity
MSLRIRAADGGHRRRICFVARSLALLILITPACTRREETSGTEKGKPARNSSANGETASVPVSGQAPSEKEKTWANPKDGQDYVWIPPGRFTMGCSAGDRQCDDDEKPAHEVTITRGFWLGQSEVTQAAYRRVLGYNPSVIEGTNRPVETVTWGDAQRFCAAVGGRLPTEAEWEYAARAGSNTARYGELDQIAWWVGNGTGGTHDVKTKAPNSFRLYDMLGNVWEWTADWKGRYLGSPATDPQGPSSGTLRVIRGASWINGKADSVRASCRPGMEDGYRFGPNVGFRCAVDLPRP